MSVNTKTDPAAPAKTSGWMGQAMGAAKEFAGSVLSDEEMQRDGHREKEIAKAEKHAARSNEDIDIATFYVAEAMREEGKAEKKLGKVMDDPDLVISGETKKHDAAIYEKSA